MHQDNTHPFLPRHATIKILFTQLFSVESHAMKNLKLMQWIWRPTTELLVGTYFLLRRLKKMNREGVWHKSTKCNINGALESFIMTMSRVYHSLEKFNFVMHCCCHRKIATTYLFSLKHVTMSTYYHMQAIYNKKESILHAWHVTNT